MSENFMTATTKIDDYASKRDQILDRIASVLAEAIIDRIQSGTMSKNTEKDVMNAIKSFSIEEQIQILSRATIYVGMNTTKNKSNYDDDDFGRPNSGKKIKSRSNILYRS